ILKRMNPVSFSVSWITGIPEPTARLLLTIILAYPIASLYNSTYVRHPNDKFHTSSNRPTEEDRNTFILLSGLMLSFFFNGTDIYHSLVTVLVSYTLAYFGIQLHQRTLASMGIWIFNAVYLLLGYYFTATNDYDISWTMPQCILCLRLMGFAFDYYDGHQTKVSTTASSTSLNKLPMSFDIDTALFDLPSLNHVLAYCYFPSGFLVGPQFSFSLYQRWIANPFYLGKTISDWDETLKAQQRYMWRSVALGILYLGIQQLIGSQYPTSYLLTDDYLNSPFLQRCWTFLITGACVAFGITYEGEDKEGSILFGGLANTLPLQYETATSLDHIIGAFNINTNLWTKYYVFKRLRFLGNKSISQGASLFFLAIWHGFHFNYFATFILEFVYTVCESILRRRLLPVVKPYIQSNDIYYGAWKVMAWITCFMTINYAIIGFDLLKLHKAWIAYKSIYFIGHLVIPLFLIVDKVLGNSRKSSLDKKT
ncbi:MBOAT, membrane-bound O-acyltransferase family-domain-containing protein, partial [Cunninghamella echinulata]